MKTADIFTTRRIVIQRHYEYVTENPDGFELGRGPSRKKSEVAAVKTLTAMAANIDKTAIFQAADGTVFLVNWCMSWQYEIIRPGKSSGCYCVTSAITFDEAKALARDHCESYIDK